MGMCHVSYLLWAWAAEQGFQCVIDLFFLSSLKRTIIRSC